LYIYVAFLSDPWGVATVGRLVLFLYTVPVAFLSDPWGVATILFCKIRSR